MSYKLILFDADDTLFDFAASQKYAFQNTLKQFDLMDQFDEIYSSYLQISMLMWQQVERGELDKEALKTKRFELTFNKHGLSLDAEHVGHTYLELLAENTHLFPETLKTCQMLSKQVRIGVVTNGIESIQKRKFAKSGLNDMIEFVVVSDQCGYAKPDRRIFDYTLHLFQHNDRSTVLMVGDRLEADVLGANRSNIASCWFNPNHLNNDTEIKPTFQIQELSQLFDLIAQGDLNANRNH